MRSLFNGDNIVWNFLGQVAFSDGSDIVWNLEKSVKPHVLAFEPKTISYVTLCDLIRADDPSPFPALSQMEVYGYWE